MTLPTPTIRVVQMSQLMQPHDLHTARLDAFTTAVPDAGFDICLLFHRTHSAQAIDRFQLLLRGMCALNRRVTRAAMIEDRIEVQIDAARLVLGHVECAHPLPLFRPDIPGASLHSGRLAYLLAHHDLALRLRIDICAPEALITEISHLAMGPHPPKAVILLAQGLLLSLAEFRAHDLAALRSMTQGPPVSMPSPRYARPGRVASDLRPSPFSPHVMRPPVPTRRQSLFGHRNTPARLPGANADALDRVVSDFCDKRALGALAAGFRMRPAKGPRLKATHKPRMDIVPKPASPHRICEDTLLCDAVMIEYRGHVGTCLAPILLATLVLVSQLTDIFSLSLLIAPNTPVLSEDVLQTRYSA